MKDILFKQDSAAIFRQDSPSLLLDFSAGNFQRWMNQE
jgi:hypothetical protein